MAHHGPRRARPGLQHVEHPPELLIILPQLLTCRCRRMMSHDVAWHIVADPKKSGPMKVYKWREIREMDGNGHESGSISSRHLNALTVTFSFHEISWNFCSSIPSFLVRLQLQPAVEALATVLPGRSPTPVQRFIMIYLYHNHNAVYYRDPAVSALLQHLNPRHAFIIIHQVNGRAASDESFWRISSNCFS